MHRRSFVARPAAAVPQSAGSSTVLLAPWVGPNDEIVLLALDARGRLIGDPMIIPHGSNRMAASEEMWDRVVRAERPMKLI